MRRLLSASVVVLAVSTAACPPSSTGEGEGEGEGGEGDEGAGEGEGEGEGDDGEGETPTLRVQVDGVDVTGAIVFPAAQAASLTGEGTTSERTVTLLPNDIDTVITLFTDPPILVGGVDASMWSVVEQPSSSIRAGGASFTLRFAPTSAGLRRGAFVFALGTRADDRVVFALEGDATAAPRSAGLVEDSYDGVFDLLPDFAALTPSSTTVVATIGLHERAGTDHFALRFRGALEVPTDGDWTFFATSDDGSRVLVDGVVIVDNDGLQAPTEVAGTTALVAGPHALEVQYFEKEGGEFLAVEWSGPDRAREALPASVLFTTP